VIVSLVVSVWVIVLIAFVVLSAALRGTSIQVGTKGSARQVKNDIEDWQFGTE
jgi:hypothetical protein